MPRGATLEDLTMQPQPISIATNTPSRARRFALMLSLVAAGAAGVLIPLYAAPKQIAANITPI